MEKSEIIMTAAKINLQNDKRLSPAAMLIKGEDIRASILMPWKDDIEKLNMLYTVGRMAKEEGCDTAIIVSDAASKRMTAEQIKDPLERPLLYPESMRQECILVIEHNFINQESSALVQPYEAKTFEIQEDPQRINNFKGDIIDFLEKGYNEQAPGI